MAYGIKYRSEFYKVQGSVLCKFEILLNNYTGGITDITASGDPVHISHEGSSSDILNPILGSSITLAFFSTTNFQFIEFMYAKNRDYRIDYYEQGVIFWQGYITPGTYEETYATEPYLVRVSGTDGLGDLRNQPYKNGTAFYTGYERDSVIIARCLALTGLSFPFLENINFQCMNANWIYYQLYAIESYQNLFIDTDSEGKMEAWSAYDVLAEILRSYQCHVFQQTHDYAACWRIIRVGNQNEAYSYAKYNTSGEGVSYGSIDPIVDITGTNGSPAIVPMSANIMCLEGWKDIKLKLDKGNKNHILDGGFEETDTDTYWETGNSLSYSREPREGGGYCVRLEAGCPVLASGTITGDADKYLKYKIPIVLPKEEHLGTYRFKLSFDVKFSLSAVDSNGTINAAVKLYRGSDSDWAHYISPENNGESNIPGFEWVNDHYFFDFNVSTAESDVWTTITAYGNITTEEDTLYLRLHRGSNSANFTGAVDYTWYDNISLTVHVDEGLETTDDYSEAIDSGNNLTGSVDDLMLGDLPTEGLFHCQKRYLDTSDEWVATNRWIISDDYGIRINTLQGHLLTWLKSARATARQIFRGTLWGNLERSLVYRDANNSSKLFFTNLVNDYDAKNNLWNIEAVEVVVPIVPVTTINSIATIADGRVTEAMTVTFNYTTDMTAVQTVYWYMSSDSAGELMVTAVNSQDISMVVGTDDTSLTDMTYNTSAQYLWIKVVNDDYVSSNQFDSVTITPTSIDTIADQEPSASITPTVNATVVGTLTDTLYWRIRNSAHETVLSGNQSIAFTTLTTAYTLSAITGPSSPATDYDFQVSMNQLSGYITSNHFDVIL